MQCPSCHFENMPTMTNCCQCGAPLAADSMAIDVHPPRARSLEKRFPFFFRIGYMLLAGLLAIPTRLGNATGCSLDYREYTLPTLLRCIIPGWNQLREPRKRALGLVLLIGWLISILLVACTIGTSIWNLCCGLLLFFHMASIIDVIFSGTQEWLSRVIYSGVTAMVVGLAIYFPAYTLFYHYYSIHHIRDNTVSFVAGDSVLSRNVTGNYTPAHGDLVFFQEHQVRFSGGGNTQYIIEGPCFDRVLALPGQSVEWKDGVLRVDGVESRVHPLGNERPRDTKFTVPENNYCIVPSMLLNDFRIPDSQTWRQLCLVSQENITGRVRWIRRSLFHFPSLDSTSEEEN